MKLKHKRLPRGWTYGLTPTQVKQLVRDLHADFRWVEFCGPRHPLDLADETVLFLGALNCRVDDDSWCYRLRLWGAPVDMLAGDRQSVRDSLLDAVKATVLGLRDTRADTTVHPRDQSLLFRITSVGLHPNFEFKSRDTLGMEVDRNNPWWL